MTLTCCRFDSWRLLGSRSSFCLHHVIKACMQNRVYSKEPAYDTCRDIYVSENGPATACNLICVCRTNVWQCDWVWTLTMYELNERISERQFGKWMPDSWCVVFPPPPRPPPLHHSSRWGGGVPMHALPITWLALSRETDDPFHWPFHFCHLTPIYSSPSSFLNCAQETCSFKYPHFFIFGEAFECSGRSTY